MSLMVECYYSGYHGNVVKLLVNCVNHTSNVLSPSSAMHLLYLMGMKVGPIPRTMHMAEETQVLLEPKSNLLNNKEFSGKKKPFLTNRNNKQAFINLLSHKLNIAGIQTSHAIGDADLLTDLTAIVHVYLLSS